MPNPSSDLAPVLAVGAHPDDIEFGCGGVIARETAVGRGAHFVIGSRGEAASNGTPEQRESEARRAAARLGATVEWVELGGDTRLEETPARARLLAAVIRRVRPAVVLAPTATERQHPDHLRLARLVAEACRLARYGGVGELREAGAPHAIGSLLHYAITAEAEPAGASPVLVDVSDEPILAAWREAMEAHGSQAATRNYVELQLARARVLGLRAGVGHAIALYPAEPLVFDSLAALGRAARRF